MEIIIKKPVLTGSVSTAKSRCGKKNCACKAKTPKLHGIYYRWTGVIDGRRTTKTISRKTAIECKKRIARLRKIQRQIDNIVAEGIANAPWTE